MPCVRNRLAHSPRCPFPLSPSAAAGWGVSLSLGELTRESPELLEPPALRPAPPRPSGPPGGLGGRAHRLFPPRPRGGARESPAGAPGRGIPAPPPSSSGSAVAGPVARREPGGGRLRRRRRGDEASRAAGGRVPGGEQNGRSVLPPGPRGLQEELLTRQCGQPVTLALSALQSRAQVRGPRDSGRELFTFFGCCLVF